MKGSMASVGQADVRQKCKMTLLAATGRSWRSAPIRVTSSGRVVRWLASPASTSPEQRRRDRPIGLSPPALAASTTITPGVAAAVLLAGAALCALAMRERPRRRYVAGGALLLAGLPWLGWTFVAAGRRRRVGAGDWTLRERRRFAALVAAEALPASLVFYATINDRFYGGLTPRSAGTRRAARRAPRLRRAPAAARRAVAGPRGRAAALGAAARRSCSSPAGCSTARAATSSRAWRRRGARPRPAPGCCSRWSARSS